MKKQVSITLLGFLGLILVGIPCWFLFSSNTVSDSQTRFVYIPTKCNDSFFKQILRDSNFIKHPTFFEQVAGLMGLWGNVKPGRYAIEPGDGNFTLVRRFRAGKQTPVRVVINKLRTSDDIIQKLDVMLEADSLSIANTLLDSANLASFELTREQMPCLIIPATYEVWWNASPKTIFDKFTNAYTRFWEGKRKATAESMGLQIPEVVTIASIVEEETNMNDEKAMIASVYLNRLKKGMNLGAEPTVKFALRNFSLRRITGQHTSFPSPYNTYFTKGLPPGPICTPSKASIDAVLQAKKTDYLFFCARSDFSGYHAFASTYNEHLKNAHKYQQALDARSIH